MNIVLIDTHSLGHAHNATTKLSCGDMPVQAIFGVMKAVQTMICRFDAVPIALWDERAQWRYDIHPTYKEKRKEPPPAVKVLKEQFHVQKPYIREAFRLMGIRNVSAENSEADDLGWQFSQRLASQGHFVTNCTADQDWWQTVTSPNVRVFNHRTDSFINFESFMGQSGYVDAATFIQGKALVGDTSDCIPPVGGIGEKGAPEFLAHFGSVTNFVRAYHAEKAKLGKVPKTVNGVKMKKAWERLAENDDGRLELFKRNLQIMDLRNAPIHPISTQKPVYDEEGLRRFCEQFAFLSILSDFDNFVAPLRAMSNKMA